MVKHVVCFKLADPSEENCRFTKEMLLSMDGKIDEILELRVGVDFLHSERSYDIILEVTVADKAALDDYQQHPYHVNAIKQHMSKVRSSSVSVDYEF